MVLLVAFSCSNDDTTDFRAQNDADIKTYLEQNSLTAEKTDTGLYYIINDLGTGASPSVNSSVTVAYKGYLLDGEVFDESENTSFNLSRLIPGFSEGAQLLKEGGSGVFLIPAHLGYGSQGSSSIPGGAVIVFDIDLISIN